MSANSLRQFYQNQLVEARAMRDRAGSHPIMGKQWEDRGRELEAELLRIKDLPDNPTAVLYFAGKPVNGSKGIDVKFASSILDSYQEMVKSEFSSGMHGPIGRRGPRKSESAARLLLTGLPRGSVGLELSPPEPDDLFTAQLLTEAFTRLGDVMQAASKDDATYSLQVIRVTGRALEKIRQFFDVLYKNEATLKMDAAQSQFTLNSTQIKTALDRLTATSIAHKDIDVSGIFRGAMLDTWRFDFKPETGEAIIGDIADGVEEAKVAQWNAFTNQKTSATLREYVVTPKNGEPKISYEILDLLSIVPSA